MFSWQYCVSASVTWYYCDNIYCGLAALCCGLCVVWSKLISPGSRKLLYRAIEQTVNSVGATITWFLYWSGCSVCVCFPLTGTTNESHHILMAVSSVNLVLCWVWSKMIVVISCVKSSITIAVLLLLSDDSVLDWKLKSSSQIMISQDQDCKCNMRKHFQFRHVTTDRKNKHEIVPWHELCRITCPLPLNK